MRLGNLIWIIGTLVLATATGIHFWVAEQNKLIRLVFPVQAVAAKLSVNCSSEAPDWMNGFTRAAIDSQKSLSTQLAYIDASGQRHHCESGWRGRMLDSQRVSFQDRFRYASLTKVLTAEAVLALVRRGELTLETPMASVLTEAQQSQDERIAEITIHDLLTHRAGFDRLKTGDALTVHGNLHPWCVHHLEALQTLRLDFAPGERYSYSNLGYCLLGVMVERVTGLPFREAMEQELGLSARGMKFVDGDFLEDEVAYDFRYSGFYDAGYVADFDFYSLSSALGLSGNAMALAALVHEIWYQDSDSNLAAFTESDCDEQRDGTCNIGFVIRSYRSSDGAMLHYHNGLLFGASSRVVVDGRGGVVVWLGNGMPPNSAAATAQFLERLGSSLRN